MASSRRTLPPRTASKSAGRVICCARVTRLSELELVAWLRTRAAAASGNPDADAGLVLGIGDDAALVEVPPGQQLVWTTDTLVAGVHYPLSTAPTDIGWKCLAVNLSDLAAMGATPCWVSLNLSLPAFEEDWITAFGAGFLALAGLHGVRLVGGDCTRASEPVLSVTALGLVPAGAALRRDGGRPGDEVWISGWPGEAAAALTRLQQAAMPAAALRARLDRPEPRVALGRALRGVASAALDVSDGLLLDLDRLCAASGCGAQLMLAALPLSAALQAAADTPAQALDWVLAGGDDYELLFTAPEEARPALTALSAQLGLPLHRIGRLRAGSAEVQVLDRSGQLHAPARRGYQHHGP